MGELHLLWLHLLQLVELHLLRQGLASSLETESAS